MSEESIIKRRVVGVLKYWKSGVAIGGACCAAGFGFFNRVDAYAQSRINDGMQLIEAQTDKKLGRMRTTVEVVKMKQEQQQKQLDRMEDKQDDIYNVLLDMKRSRDGGK